jgi:formate hydrogenlyase transcriptional activator
MLARIDKTLPPDHERPFSWMPAPASVHSRPLHLVDTFQALITDIASKCSDVEPGAVDAVVSGSLQRVAEVLQLGRVFIWCAPSGDLPGMASKLAVGHAVWFTTLDDVSSARDRDTLRHAGIRSSVLFPLGAKTAYDTGLGKTADDAGLTILVFTSPTEPGEWSPSLFERLRLIAAIIDQTLARKTSHRALQTALQQLSELRDRLTTENVELRRETRSFRSSRLIVSESAAMRRALAEAEQVGPTPATVLLLGETGVGKEVFAQALHDLSPRRQRPMIRISCAAIPTALMESELFGRERGAYTGALTRQAGRFEAANQSTLFLDEIGDLPSEVQAKLLRVLQERVIERLGSHQSIKVDVRIIAATNRNLEKAVEDNSFREDLFYRLNVFPIVIPPLRDRIEDIPGLVWAFIDEFSKAFGKTISSVSKETMRELQRYGWPGNVRELRNVVERAVILATGTHLTVPAPRPASRVPQTALTLADLEAEHIRAMLESTKWRVRGTGGAAERLGLKPTTLESRMARLGIQRPAPAA